MAHLGVPHTPQSYLYIPLMYLLLPITCLALTFPDLLLCMVWLQIPRQIPKLSMPLVASLRAVRNAEPGWHALESQAGQIRRKGFLRHLRGHLNIQSTDLLHAAANKYDLQ